MPTRALQWVMLATSLSAVACVARHPPWQLRGRPPCADTEERVDRDRAKIAELEASGSRPDDLIWHRDDLRIALRALDGCKRAEKAAKAEKGEKP